MFTAVYSQVSSLAAQESGRTFISAYAYAFSPYQNLGSQIFDSVLVIDPIPSKIDPGADVGSYSVGTIQPPLLVFMSQRACMAWRASSVKGVESSHTLLMSYTPDSGK